MTGWKCVKWNEDLIFNSNFDFITGSVHGKYTKDYQIYIQSNIEMAKNWPVDIIGHLHIPQNYAEWTDYYRDLRSEEHTSELQSRGHLVCRLLLEKKKKKKKVKNCRDINSRVE